MHESRLAAQARTAVDRASVGVLTTYGRQPTSSYTTCVAVRARDDGGVEVELAKEALAVRQLLARPLASVRVAPLGWEPVLLHGAADRLPGLGRHGLLRFHVHAWAVRVGSPPALLDEATYTAAEPDPLRHDAPQVLAHLNSAHAEALATCLRVRGHDAGFAQATRLDAAGLTVLAVSEVGADTVRLDFPAPIADLRELPPSLRNVLSPDCRCSSPERDGSSGSTAP